MAEKMSDMEGKTGENELERQSEILEDSDFNLKRQRDEIPEIVVSEGGEIHRKKLNKRHKKITRGVMVGRQVTDEENGGAEASVLAASHSHPYSDDRDSKRYQLIDPLKERERRPARSANVFDRLGDEADSYQQIA
ncbi:hypothetical protein Fot_11733 [Forsythia ovata]|uniref:Uncharacterized protein n=1 Tax=Forsythia ovata TaxID=205694 RepID=A0ABD1WND4_9LAMI